MHPLTDGHQRKPAGLTAQIRSPGAGLRTQTGAHDERLRTLEGGTEASKEKRERNQMTQSSKWSWGESMREERDGK